MQNKKLILCIDWSNIMYRSLFMTHLYDTSRTYDTEDEIDSFIWKLVTDTAYLLRTFKPDKAIFAVDSAKPWRKDILPGEEGYKSNRKKDDKRNWENIFKNVGILQDLLKDKGLKFAQCPNAEADDIVAMVKENLKDINEPYNLIIVSADADLRQLISFDEESKTFCMVYNTIAQGKGGMRKLYCTQKTIEYLEFANSSNDIFFSNFDYAKQKINGIISSNAKIKLEVADPFQIVIEKIFCGDDGDCVPSFYSWFKSNGLKDRITKGKLKKILADLNIRDMVDLELNKGMLKESLEKITKREINDIDVLERLDRQKKLVELNSTYFPMKIQRFKADLIELIERPESLEFQNLSAKQLLNGTEFDNILKKKNQKEAALFKDIDDYISKNNLEQLF